MTIYSEATCYLKSVRLSTWLWCQVLSSSLSFAALSKVSSFANLKHFCFVFNYLNTNCSVLFPFLSYNYCRTGRESVNSRIGDSLTSDSYATKAVEICYAFMQLKPEKYAPKTGFMQLFK